MAMNTSADFTEISPHLTPFHAVNPSQRSASEAQELLKNLNHFLEDHGWPACLCLGGGHFCNGPITPVWAYYAGELGPLRNCFLLDLQILRSKFFKAGFEIGVESRRAAFSEDMDVVIDFSETIDRIIFLHFIENMGWGIAQGEGMLKKLGISDEKELHDKAQGFISAVVLNDMSRRWANLLFPQDTTPEGVAAHFDARIPDWIEELELIIELAEEHVTWCHDQMIVTSYPLRRVLMEACGTWMVQWGLYIISSLRLLADVGPDLIELRAWYWSGQLVWQQGWLHIDQDMWGIIHRCMCINSHRLEHPNHRVSGCSCPSHN
jgi:hypothetical protein